MQNLAVTETKRITACERGLSSWECGGGSIVSRVVRMKISERNRCTLYSSYSQQCRWKLPSPVTPAMTRQTDTTPPPPQYPPQPQHDMPISSQQQNAIVLQLGKALVTM
jgi:hypothetical protein